MLTKPEIQANEQVTDKEKEFMFLTIEDYEQTVGFKVNDAFRIGWEIARTTKIKQ